MAAKHSRFVMGTLLSLAVASICVMSSTAYAAPKTSWSFDFSGKNADGTTPVKPGDEYTAAKGYGFEAGAAVKLAGGALSSDKPFFFSAAVPEGNYRVKVTLGSAETASDTTIKAELRRLMIEHVHTDAGKSQTVSFVVNVRTPAIVGGGQVKLKAPRESQTEAWAWDERLTLEFNNTHPAISAITIDKVEVPTVYILGDSTSCDQSGEPFCSWGQMFTRFFKDDIAIANHGESGESVASANGAGRFRKIVAQIKPGDYFMTQFGHNDMKGASAASYQAGLESWIDQIKAKGAAAIIVTPMNRHTFQGNVVTNSLQGFPDAARTAAKDKSGALIDLNALSKTLYEALGPDGSEAFFEHDSGPNPKYDGTHHSPYGAYELAKCIVQGVKQNKLELAKHIVDDYQDFDPAKPDKEADFKVPPTPRVAKETPLGS